MVLKFAKIGWLVLTLVLTIAGHSAIANDKVYDCVEHHIVGLELADDNWTPAYNEEPMGRRYSIRFNQSMSEMSGIQGGETIYHCRRFFPTKAPDLLTCRNQLVATMTFSFSTSNNKFVASFISPGGWLGDSDIMEAGEKPLSDHLIMGQCRSI